jgi:hypothetical protein
VADNVVTVMVVAVAIIVARTSSRPALGPVLIDLACVVFGLMVIFVGLIARRATSTREDTTSRTIGAVLLAVMQFCGLVTVVFLLALLGYAVGVK